jgi:hypothetical protein
MPHCVGLGIGRTAGDLMTRRGLVQLLFPCAVLAAGNEWITALGGHFETDSSGNIQAVNLRTSWVTDGDLLELARLPKLQRLDLSRTRISDQGLSYLKKASQLREVNLAYAERIGDPAHAVVKEWKNLTRLSLRGTVVADETAAAAASLPNLEALDITDTIVADIGMEALASAPKLKELSIGNIRMSELGYQSLRQFTNLLQLDLSGGKYRGNNTLSTRAVDAISSLRQLRVLKLGHVKFPVKSLATLSALANVETLGLEYSPEIGDAAVPILSGWKSLRQVDLHATKFTKEGIAALRQQRPDCKILWE